MNKNNDAFYFKCPKCPTVVPQVKLMAQATQVVKNARATLAETFKLTLWPLHSSPNKNLHPRPTTHSTDVILFTPIDGICFPMITPADCDDRQYNSRVGGGADYPKPHS